MSASCNTEHELPVPPPPPANTKTQSGFPNLARTASSTKALFSDKIFFPRVTSFPTPSAPGKSRKFCSSTPSGWSLIVVLTNSDLEKPASIKALASFDDPTVIDEVIEILYHPSNYIYYSEIISMLKELGQYEQYRSKLRNAAYQAMKQDINGDEK